MVHVSKSHHKRSASMDSISNSAAFLRPHESHLSDDIKSIIEDILEAGDNSDESDNEDHDCGESLTLDGLEHMTPHRHDSFSSRLSTGNLGLVSSKKLQNQRNGSQQGVPRRMRLFMAVLVLLGAGAAAIIVGLGLAVNARDQANDFKRLAGEVVYQLEEAMSGYTRTGLWIHQAQDAAQPGIMTHEQFHKLYQYVSSGMQFQAIGIVPRVESEEQRHNLENHTRNYLEEINAGIDYRGFLEASLTERDQAVNTKQKDPIYYPLHLLEPMDDVYSRGMLDLDLNTVLFVKEAIAEAIYEGLPALTGRLVMPSALFSGEIVPDQGYSVMIFHPGINNNQQSQQHLSMLSFQLSDLLSQINVGHMDRDAIVYIYDSSKGDVDQPIFLGGAELYNRDEDDDNDDEAGATSLSFVPEAGLEEVKQSYSKFLYEKKVIFSQREWTFIVAAEESEFFSSTVSFIYLGGAMIFVACLCLALWIYSNYKRLDKVNQIQASADYDKARLLIQNARGVARQERELNDFLSHEVRNPLSAAISAVSFVASAVNEVEPLKDEVSRKSTREDVNIIETSLTFINDLLRNMLDMHRASRKQLTVEFTPVDILRDVLEPVASMLYRRGDDYEVFIDCPEDLVVLSDGLRLKQTVLNLARNAAKFVENGWIQLRAEVSVCGNVCLYIEDTGPGIPLEKQATLFRKFQESLDSLNQGTGMGLCLSKKLVELLGGGIALDPDYDSGVEGQPGARFVISLSAKPLTDESLFEFNTSKFIALNRDDTSTADSTVSQPPGAAFGQPDEKPLRPTPTPPLPSNMSCLFVDDDIMLRKLFSRTLKRAMPEWEVREAASGETALKLVEDHRFDIIFVDQYMASAEKQLLGTETVRALRSKGVASVICGLSANDLEGTFLNSGADAFMIKPFPCKKEELKEALAQIIGSTRQQTEEFQDRA